MTDKHPKQPVTVQDVFVSAITSSLAPSSPKGDPNSSPQIPFDDDDSYVAPFSLHILTQNFKKISSRIGILFQIKDNLTSIFHWENPYKTFSFLCIYTLICMNPFLIVMIPSAVLIFGFLLPSYETRYPDPYSDIISLNNKDITASKKSNTNGKSSEAKDFTLNIRNIQNSMSEYTQFYDLVYGFLLKYTSFNDDKLSSTVFLFCIIISLFLMIFSHWISLRLIFLLFGWISVLSINTNVQKAIRTLIEEYKKNKLHLESNLFFNFDYIHNWINYNYIAPEIQKKAVFVEIFEFELKTDQKNEKLIYYSSNPYAVPPNKTSTPAEEGLRELLYDDSSITGSINCIYPPEGYKFEKNSFWKVDDSNSENLSFNLNHKDWRRRKLRREVVLS
ncbi:hypothetical protein T552_04108 [Pneumocystis carinii B80]|uniref:TECPR1-like DysF domain-containing protein n=1 Tax=Pneumocystis carinii (strain B80) TaxID=1408658 RepID=A0A0W4ZLW0_PNEC8|nr:hypothetical protein T552_04108 [Pneumocystis carinii B80]KTW29361.1 hypothetical protein T552_04108 [Pneumocystis carinii B80]